MMCDTYFVIHGHSQHTRHANNLLLRDTVIRSQRFSIPCLTERVQRHRRMGGE